MTMRSVNPTTGEEIAAYPETSDAEADAILARAVEAQRDWEKRPFAERVVPLRRAAELLRAGAGGFARLMALEMGKPLTQGRFEVEKCALGCDHYATHAEAYLASQDAPTEARASYVTFRPLGVVLAVMPWNFPFWQVLRFAAPALMAGNAAILKHASNVQGCSLAIEELLRRAGFPPDLFRSVVVPGSRVGRLIAHPAVAAVTLTGSTPAGREVAAAAGRALKKTVLELGGSDPYVVLADAEVAKAAEVCVTSRLQNTGQSCIAAKRFIVVEQVRAEFTERVLDLMRAARYGDPLASVDLGPLARRDLRDDLHDQVVRSRNAGADLLLGGAIPDGPGAFYPPTVLSNVRRGMAAYHEETFGPVAAILPARDDEEAIAIANDTSFGLGAAVFTHDLARGERIAAERLNAGCCFVNALVRSDPRLPFGGVKDSGYGRELSLFGIREFVNVKTVYVA